MTIINFFKKPVVFVERVTQKFLFVKFYNRSFQNKVAVETSKSNLTSKKIFSSVVMPQISNNVEFEILPTPVKSASDKKEYRVIRLKIGLTACLIQDTKTQITDDDQGETDDSESSSSASTSSAESEEENEETEDENEQTEESDCENNDNKKTHGHEQKMAAAGLCIGVGSYSDPKNVPGMAHFLEHMVFMGSEKFPQENDFDAFITKRGGSDNASTDCEVTTFYFECLEKHFYTALDKFAQFFISPLMKRDAITREREAIESEFQMALPSDVNRKEQLLASFATEDSPVNTFTWGNLITLRDNVSEDDLYKGVHEFRKRHYSAHRMTLAIQAQLPLDELQSFVLECFNNVPSNDLPPDDFKKFKDVFDTPEFTKIYYIQPVNEMSQLELTWALPPLLDKYKSKPHQYVSWILGDEGKGSLLSYLKKKVWVLSISAGNAETGNEFSSIFALFTISMTLTTEGLKHIFEIIEIIFSYISMLIKLGPQERIYKEIKTIADVSFKFATEDTAAETVEDLCENMQFYPPEDYITGSELYLEYDPKAIQMILDSLIPNKMNIFVLCNDLPSGLTFDKTEKWFGTKYAQQDIPKEWLKKWQNASVKKQLSLPPPNQFLTEDFTILPDVENHPEYPEKIEKTNIVELWYRKDQKFNLPIAYFKFYFISPKSLETSKNAALADLYVSLLQISLAEEAYPAQVADLSYYLKNYDKGILLTVSGYNQKLHILIELIIKHFTNFKSYLTEEMFKAVKDKLIKYYHNSLLKPNSLAKDVRLDMLISNYHPLTEKYNVASSLTLTDIQQFSDDFISNLFIKSLVQGNVTKEHAINVVNNLITMLKCKPLDPATYPNFRVCQIPKGENFCVIESFNKNNSNSIITNYYQGDPFSVKDSVIMEILMMILQEPLFDTLRTKEQLGYDVRCCNRDTCGILGFSITVNAQATKNTTDYVDQRIEEFIKLSYQLLADTSEKSFEETKKDIIKTKRCSDVHLKEEVSRNWSEIIDEDYIFDRLKLEMEEIEKLTLDEVRKWWETHTHAEGDNNLRKLSVQVTGFKNVEQKEEDSNGFGKGGKVVYNFVKLEANSEKKNQFFIKHVDDFKKTLYLYPVTSKYVI